MNIRIILVLMLLLPTMAHARWATIADAPIEILSSDVQITVKKDGKYDLFYETKIKIINERGRDAIATFPLYYKEDNSKLEIITARTINGKEIINIDKSTIEDKPMASEVQGFDQKHQVLLAFPSVKVGSIIHLKYKLKMLKPDLPGFFENYSSIGAQYTKTASIQINSELPLYYNYNNPDNYFTIEHTKHDETYSLSAKLNKPIYIDIVDEGQHNINPAKYPWFFVATSDNAKIINQQIADPFLKVMQQPLPSLYQDIVNNAQKSTDKVEQINLVTSQLNEAVKYMGDWKTANGRLVPQDLAKVAQRRMGDCKDFATGTAVMLNALGMNAKVALVYRQSGIYYHEHIILPGISEYNHAMVKVQVGKDIYWVDPTNFFSAANIILPDIADRPALVLTEKTKKEHIPTSEISDSMTIAVKNVDLKNPELAKVSGDFKLHGLSAIEYTGSELQTSKATIENSILYQVGNYDYMSGQSVTLPNLTSRIVRDLDFKYSFNEQDFVTKSNAGFVIPIAGVSNVAQGYIFNRDNVSDIYLGPPHKGTLTYTFRNIKPAGTDPLDSNLSSPWLDITRKVTYGNNTATVAYEYQVKASKLDQVTIRTPEYQRMVKQLSKDFSGGISIIFKG